MNALAIPHRLVALATGLFVCASAAASAPEWAPHGHDSIVMTHGHGAVRVNRHALGSIHEQTRALHYTADWSCGALGFSAICEPKVESLTSGVRVVRVSPGECEVRERLIVGIDLYAANHFVTQTPRVVSYAWVVPC